MMGNRKKKVLFWKRRASAGKGEKFAGLCASSRPRLEHVQVVGLLAVEGLGAGVGPLVWDNRAKDGKLGGGEIA